MIARLLIPLMFVAAVASGATFTVSNTNDSGPGSLRQAVNDANASPGPDTVLLTDVTGTIVLTTGEISSTGTLAIIGPGSGTLAISGGGSSRVMNHTGSGLTIEHLTLRDGFSATYGGAIAASALTLVDVVVSDSRAETGGGLFVFVRADIRNSTITRNSAAEGGGAFFQDADITIADTTVAANSARSAGGGLIFGICNVTLDRVRVEGNTAVTAGGIYDLYSTTSIKRSSITGNSSERDGGGIRQSFSSTTIDESRVSGNKGRRGGGLFVDAILITRSEITHNQASLEGGGVWGRAGLENCTLSNNTAALRGGGAALWYGAGFYQTTIVDNSASEGGGLFLVPDSHTYTTATLANSILARNVASSGPDVGGTGTLRARYSIIQNLSSSVVLETDDTDRLGVDPLLGPLQHNGGATFTHLPLPGSPAIDAAGPLDRTLQHNTDQRGEPRPVGPAADMGAVEVSAADLQDIPTLTPPVLTLLALLLAALALFTLSNYEIFR